MIPVWNIVKKSSILKNFSKALSTQISKLDFVPESSVPTEQEILQLQKFLGSSGKLLVLTGAGLSTESGIPDYRSEEVGLYARSTRRPVQYQEFLKYPEARQRYWARNYVGWIQFSSFEPNLCHKILSDWERKGKVFWIVTQNVDALHTKAGTKNLTELHGCAHRVHCISCNRFTRRHDFQETLLQHNPEFDAESLEIMPDGDVFLPDERVKKFKVPSCDRCGGILKPDVTFFGDNVPRTVVDFVFEKVKACERLLVLGSSLFVFSGYRFILRAKELNKPIAVVNIGPTRADDLVNLKLSTRCGLVLPHIRL